MTTKGHPEAFCGDENILYLDSINVNILGVISYYGFARHYHWGKMDIQYMKPVFLTSACDFTINSK